MSFQGIVNAQHYESMGIIIAAQHHRVGL